MTKTTHPRVSATKTTRPRGSARKSTGPRGLPVKDHDKMIPNGYLSYVMNQKALAISTWFLVFAWRAFQCEECGPYRMYLDNLEAALPVDYLFQMGKSQNKEESNVARINHTMNKFYDENCNQSIFIWKHNRINLTSTIKQLLICLLADRTCVHSNPTVDTEVDFVNVKTFKEKFIMAYHQIYKDVLPTTTLPMSTPSLNPSSYRPMVSTTNSISGILPQLCNTVNPDSDTVTIAKHQSTQSIVEVLFALSFLGNILLITILLYHCGQYKWQTRVQRNRESDSIVVSSVEAQNLTAFSRDSHH